MPSASALRYRREPRLDEDGLLECRRLAKILGALTPPQGFRFERYRLSCGIVLVFRGPQGAVRLKISPPGSTNPLRQVKDACLTVEGDDTAAAQASPIVDAIARALSAIARKRPEGFLRHALAAASLRHDFDGSTRIVCLGHKAELRLLLACNQRCFFCNCDENAPNLARTPPEAETLVRALFDAGARHLIITGGEPTLHPALPSIVALARKVGFERVNLQTNSMLLGEGELAAELAAAGLTSTFASLHGANAAAADLVTGTPGGFERTLRGIEACLGADISVTVNFVASRRNLGQLPGLVPFLQSRFKRQLAGVVLSYMSPIASGRDNLGQMPRLAAVSAKFKETIRVGGDEGLRVRIAGVCGIPLCQLKGFEKSSDEHGNVHQTSLSDDRRLGLPCQRCAFKDRCTGFWKYYLDRHGDQELCPFETDPAPPGKEGVSAVPGALPYGQAL